jgi:2-polyprenyl-3-methyl-5-hydroxy-6-metoxy-1,4-benzoquinol methylase
MIYKNFKNKVKNYWKKLDNEKNYTVPNETIFRLLSHRKFNFKNKKILDIGIGDGANLLEFNRRGAKIYGTDIRKGMIKKFYKTYGFSSKNYFIADLNYQFPDLRVKMDFINCKDTICYLDKNKQFDFIYNCKKNLKKNGLFLFQYIQKQLVKKNNQIFDFNLKKDHKELKEYFNKSNPIPFLTNKHVNNLIKFSKMKVEKSIFDLTTHTKEKKQIIDVNRYFLLRKTKI